MLCVFKIVCFVGVKALCAVRAHLCHVLCVFSLLRTHEICLVLVLFDSWDERKQRKRRPRERAMREMRADCERGHRETKERDESRFKERSGEQRREEEKDRYQPTPQHTNQPGHPKWGPSVDK